jgi:hypothetical protein
VHREFLPVKSLCHHFSYNEKANAAQKDEKAGYKIQRHVIPIYEKAVAVSGYTIGVNPFDQPGVESYKKNMFALLDKPGYADYKAELDARLADLA